MKTVVRLLVAATVALGAAPVIASSASADVDPEVRCVASLGQNLEYGRAEATNPDSNVYAGYLNTYTDRDSGAVCIEAFPSGNGLDSATDVGTAELRYTVDGVPSVERMTFTRNRSGLFSTSVRPDVGLTDVSLRVVYPRSKVVTEAYTEQVACTTPGVREVEREVVRKVPSIVESTRYVTRRPTSDVRYAARAGLTQKNVQARTKYIRAAKRAEARGNEARGARLRAKFAKVRAANVTAYRKAMAPKRVKVVTQSVVYRDTVVKEKVNEVYDRAGTCTVSGEKLVLRVVDEVYTSGALRNGGI